VSVADALAGPWSDPQQVGTGAYTTLTGLGEGRYVRFVADFVRGDKRAPEIGPQAYGLMPLLTKFEVTNRVSFLLWPVQRAAVLVSMQLCMPHEQPTALPAIPVLACLHSCPGAAADVLPCRRQQVIPANNYPTAICAEKSVPADNPTDQTNSLYGTNADGRMCGAILDASTAVNDGASSGGSSGHASSMAPTDFSNSSLTACPPLTSCCCSTGSHDPDTAELDSIIPIQPTASFYSPQLYKLVRPCSTHALDIVDSSICSIEEWMNDSLALPAIDISLRLTWR
jgi:hypothetical protein